MAITVSIAMAIAMVIARAMQRVWYSAIQYRTVKYRKSVVQYQAAEGANRKGARAEGHPCSVLIANHHLVEQDAHLPLRM